MYCTMCGKQIADASTKCTFCGHKMMTLKEFAAFQTQGKVTNTKKFTIYRA